MQIFNIHNREKERKLPFPVEKRGEPECFTALAQNRRRSIQKYYRKRRKDVDEEKFI